jgi:hypothetical protein
MGEMDLQLQGIRRREGRVREASLSTTLSFSS